MRRGAAAALAAINRKEIGSVFTPAPKHRLAELVHEIPSADRGHNADRTPGEIAQIGDAVAQVIDVSDIMVTIGADRILFRRNAANARDFVRHLGRRQDATLTRLRPLRELDLERLDDVRELPRFFGREKTVEIADAVLRRADLHDHVAIAFEMIW